MEDKPKTLVNELSQNDWRTTIQRINLRVANQLFYKRFQ